MANEGHVTRLNEGTKAWNVWRRENRAVTPDLSGVELDQLDLTDADLQGADFSNATILRVTLDRANLSSAFLTRTYFHFTKLRHADLRNANLALASLFAVELDGADLRESNLVGAAIHYSTMSGARLNDAILEGTLLADIDLSEVLGLESCYHGGRSAIDHQTIEKSKSLPVPFLRGLGFSDSFIAYLPALTASAIQYYSCFMSYSTFDQEFSRRLYADLQDKGIRCWFAPHDMLIGQKILDTIDSAIRLRDKLLLVLSEHSIRSDWVEDEVTKAFEEERKRSQTVLFPIRLDDAVMDTNEAWAAKLRARHIGDFTRWKEHDEYQKSFARVLRDLTVKKP